MNNAAPLFSIVVPVYNCARFLPDCIRSIAALEGGSFECLLVDDGSTDDSGALCDAAAGQDSRFRPIHKPNGGVCSARNAGLDHARGRFVLFCDQDDRMHPETLRRVLAAHEQDTDDLILWPYTRDPAEFAAPLPEGEEVYPPARFGSLYCTFMVPPVWNKLFERELVEQTPALRFDETIHSGHEDLPFVYDYLRRLLEKRPAARVRMQNAPLYYWSDENEESVSKKSRHFRHYIEIEMSLFERFLTDCRELYHPEDRDMVQVYLHYIHPLAYGVVCGKNYGDMPKNFWSRPEVDALLDWILAHRAYTPFYLPFRLKWNGLVRLVFWAEQNSKWWYGKLYWAQYYLLGGNWNR